MKRRVLLAGVLLAAWGLSAQQSTQPGSFTLPIGGGALVIGDLNKDGKQDMVTARSDAVTVYLGDGRGRFDRAAGAPFPAGNNPNDLALGDFDEDGRLDIAIANHETSYSTLLLGDGKGGLAPPARIIVPSRPHPHGIAAGEPKRLSVGPKPYHKLRAGDLNNDRKDDLVTTNTDGSSVSVLCTDRSGVLQPAKEIAIAKSPFAVAIGEVNGDRYPDLAVAHRWGAVDPKLDGLTVLIGTGDCVFTPTSESPLRVGASPTAVAIGDFDGDGIGDIATANMGSDNVTMFLGSRTGLSAGKGSPFSVGKGPLTIALKDLNGDGKADIVTGNGGSGDLSVVLSP